MSKNIHPLHLIKLADGTNAMVELKSGQTYNGILKGVDKFMNIKMQNAVLSDKNAQLFHEVKEVYIKGNHIKYFSLDNDLTTKIENTEYVAPQKWKKSDIKHNKFRSKTQKK